MIYTRETVEKLLAYGETATGRNAPDRTTLTISFGEAEDSVGQNQTKSAVMAMRNIKSD